MRLGKFTTKAMDVVLNYLGYLLFITAGVISVLASALIEYQVVDALVSTSLVAFFIVFAAEMTKLFSIYLHKQYMVIEDQAYVKGNVYGPLRFFLVSLSVVCTLVFLFHELHNPEYDAQVSRATSEVATKYERRLANINDDFDKRFEGVGDEVTKWQKELADEIKNVVNGTPEGPSFESYYKLYDRYERRKKSDRIQLQREKAERVNDLERWHDEEVSSEKHTLRTATSSHNPMISAVLQVINGGPDYPLSQYTAAIILLSLLVSVVLELIIVYVFHVLAVEHGDMA